MRVGMSSRVAGLGRKVVPSLTHNGRAGSTEPRHGRSEIQQRSLSIGRAIVPGCVDDGARIRLRILLPAFATRVRRVKGFVAGVVAWIPSAAVRGLDGERRRQTFVTLVARRIDQGFAVVE